MEIQIKAMSEFLEKNRLLPPRELTKQCFLWMFNQLQRYPMLKKADNETVDYLYRKLPRKVIEARTKDDTDNSAVMEIMLDGVLKEIVSDEND